MSISNNKIVNNFNNMAGPLEMLNISTDFWSKLVPPCKMVFDLNCVDRLLEHTNAIDYIRYCFNNSSRAISYYEDIIRNNYSDNDEVKKIYKNVINKITEIGGSDDIAESLRKIRNSVAHLNYNLVVFENPIDVMYYSMEKDEISDEKDFFGVKIENSDISITIPLSSFFDLETNYGVIVSFCDKKIKIDNMDDFYNCNAKNYEVLIEKMKKGIINDKPITSDQIDFICNYINYIGIDYWNSLTSDYRKHILRRCILPLTEEYQFFDYTSYSMIPIAYMYLMRDIDVINYNLERRHLYPHGYAVSLLDSAFYVFNYYKTLVNDSNDLEIDNELLCSDINLKGVKFIPTGDSSDSVEEKNKFIMEKVLFTEEELNNMIKKCDIDIMNLNKLILQDETKIKLNPDKNTAENNNKIKLNKQKRDNKKREKEEYKNILNSKKFTLLKQSEFFRSLRNSVSHGRYHIDFNPGFESKDLNNSIVTFWDIDPITNDYNFMVQMKAEVLRRIIKEFGDKLIPLNEMFDLEETEKKFRNR